MKFLLIISIVLIHQISSGQLIKSPNETKNGIKTGLWNEQEFLDSMSIDGHSKLIFGEHNAPLYAISEGTYLNGEKTGIWRHFWIEMFLDSGKVKYRRGQVKDIVEYEGGYRNGLFLSYFKNGQVRLVGQFRKIGELSIDTIPFTNPKTGIEKDTILISNYSSGMIGKWYEFDSTGNLKKIKTYDQQAAKKHDD